MNSPQKENEKSNAFAMLRSSLINDKDPNFIKLLEEQGISSEETLYNAFKEDNNIREELCKFIKAGLRETFRQYFLQTKNLSQSNSISPSNTNNNTSRIINNTNISEKNKKRCRNETDNTAEDANDNIAEDNNNNIPTKKQENKPKTNNNIQWKPTLVHKLFTILSNIIQSNKNTLTTKNEVIRYLKANKDNEDVLSLINTLNISKLDTITAYYYNSKYSKCLYKFDKLPKDILDICFFQTREEKIKW